MGRKHTTEAKEKIRESLIRYHQLRKAAQASDQKKAFLSANFSAGHPDGLQPEVRYTGRKRPTSSSLSVQATNNEGSDGR